MPKYVDGFVVPVPKKKLQAYGRIARKAGRTWREHGALRYVECDADDVKPGEFTSFPRSVKLKSAEPVSRKHRDRVNAKAMKDARMADMIDPKRQPVDGKRMFCGGFKVLVELRPRRGGGNDR